jgi:hypothetical protein
MVGLGVLIIIKGVYYIATMVFKLEFSKDDATSFNTGDHHLSSFIAFHQ